MLFSGIYAISAEQYVFGGKNGWNKITSRKGISTVKGRFGYDALSLSSDQVQVNESTDLLINFENGEIRDSAGNYSVKESELFLTDKAVRGKGAALSRNHKGGLVLSGKSGSFFNTTGPQGSFEIDFWLNPAVVENGETVMNWRSSRNVWGKIQYQLISAMIYQNKLLFTFSNIFDGFVGNQNEASLVSSKKLVPGKWSHHSISFEEDSGALSYRIDGELEDIKFITSTGHEGGSICQAVFGVGADFELCPEFSGMIDDFRILRSYENIDFQAEQENSQNLNPVRYETSGGRFESEPVLTKAGSIYKSVNAEVSIPKETAVQFYIRSGDNCFNWTDSYPEWKSVKLGETLENVTGLYFQIACDIYPDGAGSVSPYVSEISVDYASLPEPQPPYRLTAEKGDGSVTLRWSYSTDDTAGGYLIYYGNRPGEYLGRIAVEGPSPINAGNVTSYTLSGLKNGTIYYFAVSAFSKIDNRICGPLSKEVYARPGVSDGR